MIEEILEYQLPDGRLNYVVSKWIIDETHPLADDEGRVFIARVNQNLDLTGAILLSPGSIATMSAESEAQDKLDTDAAINAYEAQQASEIQQARDVLIRSKLPLDTINALLKLQGLPPIERKKK